MGRLKISHRINKYMYDLTGFLVSIVRFPKYLALKSNLKKNQDLVKQKKSDKCFICGLGPSLKDVDFSKLDGDIITVNGFYKFDINREISPDFYCMVDGAYERDPLLDEMYEAIDKYDKTQFVLNGKFRHVIEKKYHNAENVSYLADWKSFFNPNKKIDYSKYSSALGNVVCVAIGMALYLEYKEIVLLGCDFNSFAATKSSHCYVEENDDRKLSLGFELYAYSLVIQTHYELSKYANFHGLKIINATPNSLIDAYTRNEEYYEKYYKPIRKE